MISKKIEDFVEKTNAYIKAKFLIDKRYWRNKIFYQCSCLKLNDNFSYLALLNII